MLIKVKIDPHTERVKRERPDYYDALEFDNKRKNNTTPTRHGYEYGGLIYRRYNSVHATNRYQNKA